MAIEASRRIPDGSVCFVGVGLPTLAANLARLTHAPTSVLVFESGTIGAKPTRPPHSIADGELARTADFVVPMPEIFAYWLQGGKIDIGFLGAAQVDRFANLNSTVIGPYDQPTVRLPGGGGAPEISAASKRIYVMLPHSRRAFVNALDFRTTLGNGDGPDARKRLGLPGGGVSAVVTDLGVLEPEPDTRELQLTMVHPGVTIDDVREATDWDLRVAPQVRQTSRPTDVELTTLRKMKRV
jgi:glutaconate CoA-transferase subunit B